MQYIKAPFNFVPVSNHVYFPDWADQISHDVPFSDGLSGQITVELKAETPIFIRDSEEITRFCHIKDKNGNAEFFIPGTSLKGTIRSVLEILSFAKMDKINDHKFAIRDLHNPDVYNLMKDSKNIRCGWLRTKKDENGEDIGIIRDCDRPWRISHEQLDAEFKTNFVSKFKKDSIDTIDFGKDSNKTAKFKYEIISNTKCTLVHNFIPTLEVNNQQRCKFSNKGQKGTVVLTGQPGVRGKFYEFVFIEPTDLNSDPIIVDAKTLSEFKFHYLDHDPKHISADWQWRKEELLNGNEIPVFFRTDKTIKTIVKDLGLSYLYKMPYTHSVKSLLPEDHKLGFFKPDLAECILGFTDDEDALKGRVQFPAARADMATAKEDELKSTILGSPKASYYPIYIKQLKQQNEDGFVVRKDNRPFYNTYMDLKAELSGRKRYPVRDGISSNMPKGTPNMGVQFIPLKKGAKFIAKINYFNLRPVELGGLLSALTFHNNATECYHGLGMAKSYGFGRVSLRIINDVENTNKYLTAFETAVETYLRVKDPDFFWYKSIQIKEFIAMAKVQKFLDNKEYNSRMKYMDLPDFAGAKADKKFDSGIEKRGFYLEKYSEIVPNNPDIKSYSDDKLEAEIKPQAINAYKQLNKEKISFLEEERLKKVALELEKEEKEKKKKQKEEDDRLKKLKEKEEAEQKRLDEIMQKQLQLQAEIDKKQQEELARIAERNNQLKAIGLDSLIKEISDFDRGKKQIESYMKRIGVSQLDINDTEALLKKATDWYFATPNKQRENRWKPTDGPDWKKIALYIGKELAQKWYNDLISKS